MNKIILLLALSIMLLLSSCTDSANAIPDCIKNMWEETEGDNTYISMWSYEWNGETVYLFHAGCCDRLDELRDENCTYLCSPTGGFGGNGDGSCPEFMEEATDKKILFE